jgi:hypothetical protein
MTIIIYNGEQTISMEEFFELLKLNTYQNVKAIKKEYVVDVEKNINVECDRAVANHFDIFVEVVKEIAGSYQLDNDNHSFNLNDTILSFDRDDDFSKIEFAMNSKQSYLYPKNNNECFGMYSVPFEFVLNVLESQLKNPNAKFGEIFDSC